MSHANRSGCPRKVHREVHMTVNSKGHWGIDGQHVMVMLIVRDTGGSMVSM